MSTTTIEPKKARALPPLMSLTDAAADRLRRLYAQGRAGQAAARRGPDQGLLRHVLRHVVGRRRPVPGDEVVRDKGLTVLVDRKASLFLIGTIMDYAVSDLSAGFTFVNPNEKGRCGCGESFHV